jgi:hypothetical protein
LVGRMVGEGRRSGKGGRHGMNRAREMKHSAARMALTVSPERVGGSAVGLNDDGDRREPSE